MTKRRTRTRSGPVLRALAVFLATYGALMTILFFWGADSIERYTNVWTAKTAAWALWLLGENGRAHADVVESSLPTIRILSECTVLYPLVIFASAVVASPTTWRHKMTAVLGVPLLAIVNLLRIVSLCYIGRWFPGAMDMSHFVIWESLMVFFTVLLWLLWAARSDSFHDPSSA